jgi:hypothetical protein
MVGIPNFHETPFLRTKLRLRKHQFPHAVWAVPEDGESPADSHGKPDRLGGGIAMDALMVDIKDIPPATAGRPVPTSRRASLPRR